MSYEEIYQQSINKPETFWAEAAQEIYWHKPPQQILDYSNPPFRKWYVGGETNLCYNAVDRHLAERADQLALISISTETNITTEYTYAQVYKEVNAFAAIFKKLGVERGDRVVIYMPNIADAAFAMLACARVGAIHSVVFGGFAARNLAVRIDDTQPKLLVCADAGMRSGKVLPYKPIVDQACSEASSPPPQVLVISRGLVPDIAMKDGRDVHYADLRKQVGNEEVPVEWLESNETSYLLYTSGTTGKPKGVQRDIGGYAVGLMLSMRNIFDVAPGQVIFSTSDVGWVVGHSYNVYGPLLMGCTSLLYEGLPTSPDPGIWWELCEKHNVRTLFSSPTAIRVLKKHDTSYINQHKLSKLQYLFLVGEPLDIPTAEWISEALGKPVIDNYWQSETGYPVLALMPGLDMKPIKFGSPGLPNFGYNLKVINETTGKEAAANEKGVLVIQPPLPPGCLSTVWNDDKRFISSYFSHFKELVYSSQDWAIRDEDGYVFILGRTDDVINVAGHRLGTREIEESASDFSAVAEVAVVGVHDELKGQVPIVFATLRRSGSSDDVHDAVNGMLKTVETSLGSIARPARVYIVDALPKTRSGKLLRRSLQALAEGQDPGDLSTLDDPGVLDDIKRILERGPDTGKK